MFSREAKRLHSKHPNSSIEQCYEMLVQFSFDKADKVMNDIEKITKEFPFLGYENCVLFLNGCGNDVEAALDELRFTMNRESTNLGDINNNENDCNNNGYRNYNENNYNNNNDFINNNENDYNISQNNYYGNYNENNYDNNYNDNNNNYNDNNNNYNDYNNNYNDYNNNYNGNNNNNYNNNNNGNNNNNYNNNNNGNNNNYNDYNNNYNDYNNNYINYNEITSTTPENNIPQSTLNNKEEKRKSNIKKMRAMFPYTPVETIEKSYDDANGDVNAACLILSEKPESNQINVKKHSLKITSHIDLKNYKNQKNLKVIDLHNRKFYKLQIVLEEVRTAVDQSLLDEKIEYIIIITGKGNHSVGGIAIYKPNVLNFLKSKKINAYIPKENEGVIVCKMK